MNSLSSKSTSIVDEDDDSEEEEGQTQATVSEELQKRYNLVNENIFAHYHPQHAINISNSYRWGCEMETTMDFSTLCYNEVNPFAFLQLLIRLEDYGIEFGEEPHFVDVGCGCGKTLVVASLLNKFKRVIGIEIVPGLYRKCQDVVKKFNSYYRTPMDQSDIELWFGDGANMDWSFVSLAYIQATNFDEGMMHRISLMADRLSAGSIVILINNRLTEDSHFDLVGITSVEYYYDFLSVFIYKRNSFGQKQHPDAVKRRMNHILKKRYIIPIL